MLTEVTGMDRDKEDIPVFLPCLSVRLMDLLDQSDPQAAIITCTLMSELDIYLPITRLDCSSSKIVS
jgi:hypothetical protein